MQKQENNKIERSIHLLKLWSKSIPFRYFIHGVPWIKGQICILSRKSFDYIFGFFYLLVVIVYGKTLIKKNDGMFCIRFNLDTTGQIEKLKQYETIEIITRNKIFFTFLVTSIQDINMMFRKHLKCRNLHYQMSAHKLLLSNISRFSSSILL